MDDVLMYVLITIFAGFFGFAAGQAFSTDAVNNDCKDYQQYVTGKYILTCKAR